jgi:hypothetical protein
MEGEVRQYLELLERRLSALRMLATDLDECRSAYVTLDLQGIHRHISRQESLCTEIRALDTELLHMKKKLRGSATETAMPSTFSGLEARLDPESARQLHLLLGGLKAIQVDVRRLSRVHAELLRRSRRSVNVLLNFLAHYAGTYPLSLTQSRGMPLVSPAK